MITLKVKSRGHLVEIPGLPAFRTPANIDVSKADIRGVIGHLKVCGIEDYEIVAKSESGVVEVYKKEDFELSKKKDSDPPELDRKEINKRFNKLEKMIAKLAQKKASKTDSEKEQINDKLERLEQLTERILEESLVKDVVYTKTIGEGKKADNIEDLEDAYIPNIDVSDMTISSGGSKTLEQDSDDLEDSADLLAGLGNEKEAK